MVLSSIPRWLAFAAAIALASATQCTCPDPTPCQHLSGTACYALTTNTAWKAIDSAEGHASCPKETRHCACDCSGDSPCRAVDKSGDVTCVGTIEMYGKSVCPLGAAHCQSPAQNPAIVSAPAVTPSVPSPPGAALVCKCAGSKPCLHSASGICTSMIDGGCPADTVACRCGCTGANPCQHGSIQQCFPVQYEGANKICPAATTLCEVHGPSSSSIPDDLCRCGGAAPCQNVLDSTGTACEPLRSNDIGVLSCATGFQQCDCDCDTAQPCRYVDETTHKGYCFAATANGACPEGTKRCNAPLKLVSAAVESHPPSPAPPPPPNSVHVDASMLLTEAPTPVPQSDSGIKNCVYDGWTEWSTCTRKCGGGTKNRSVKVTQLPSEGGEACPRDQIMACNEQACDNVDCAISGWDAWTPCTHDCGGGLQYSNPIVDSPAKDYGAACPAPKARKCNTQSCFTSHAKCNCDPLAGDAVPLLAEQPPAKGELSCMHSPGCACQGRKPCIHSTSGACTSMVGDSCPSGTIACNNVIRVFHPTCDGSADCANTNAGYHNCAYSPAKGCKCCTCQTLNCFASEWGTWSSCDSAEYGGVSVITRTRTRQVEGKTLAAEGVVCPHVTQREVCASATASP